MKTLNFAVDAVSVDLGECSVRFAQVALAEGFERSATRRASTGHDGGRAGTDFHDKRAITYRSKSALMPTWKSNNTYNG